jgi:prevent-host-death family protein
VRTAGIREARQSLSALLEDVHNGRQVVITDRGRPVARLIPPLPLSAQAFPGRAGLRRSLPLLQPSLSKPVGSGRTPGRAWDKIPGPLYLDGSALAPLYFPQAESAGLERALRGRRDLTVSDLAASELLSAVARRRRAGELSDAVAARFHAALLADLQAGIYRRAEIAPATHRSAERLLLSMAVPLRTVDALHLALAMTAGVASMLTFEQELAAGARALGLVVRP